MVNPVQIQNKITAIINRDDLNRKVLVNIYDRVEDTTWKTTRTIFRAQTVYSVILLDYKKKRKIYDRAGRYKDSSLIMLLPANTSIKTFWTVEIGDIEYDIDGIDDTPLSNYNMLQRVFLTRTPKNNKELE